MSRHGRVDAGGVARSINAVCTCVRSLTIKKIENRQINIWIRELSFSNRPGDVEKLGALEKGQEAQIYVPSEVFDQAWEAALADDVTTKQINLTLRVDDDAPDHLPVIAVALDELSPRKKVELRSASVRLSDTVSSILWILGAVYATYAIAKYLKAI